MHQTFGVTLPHPCACTRQWTSLQAVIRMGQRKKQKNNASNVPIPPVTLLSHRSEKKTMKVKKEDSVVWDRANSKGGCKARAFLTTVTLLLVSQQVWVFCTHVQNFFHPHPSTPPFFKFLSHHLQEPLVALKAIIKWCSLVPNDCNDKYYTLYLKKKTF